MTPDLGLPRWTWVSSGLIGLGVSFAAALWIWLPSLAPDLVLRTSPWLAPAARAAVAGQMPARFAQRVHDRGPAALPALCRCLRHPQVAVRRLAAWTALREYRPDTLDPRLRKALTRASDDDDAQVASLARRVLRGRSHAPAPMPTRGLPTTATADAPAADDEDDEDDESE